MMMRLDFSLNKKIINIKKHNTTVYSILRGWLGKTECYTAVVVLVSDSVSNYY